MVLNTDISHIAAASPFSANERNRSISRSIIGSFFQHRVKTDLCDKFGSCKETASPFVQLPRRKS
jgi:hypothetical protein